MASKLHETSLEVYLTMHPRQIEAVLNLPAPKRYDHFVKMVADREVAWGLYADGWALAATSEGTPVFPLWPAREYAELCAAGDWAGYAPAEIDVEEILGDLLPGLSRRKTVLGVFPTPELGGGLPELSVFESDLRSELANTNSRGSPLAAFETIPRRGEWIWRKSGESARRRSTRNSSETGGTESSL